MRIVHSCARSRLGFLPSRNSTKPSKRGFCCLHHLVLWARLLSGGLGGDRDAVEGKA